MLWFNNRLFVYFTCYIHFAFLLSQMAKNNTATEEYVFEPDEMSSAVYILVSSLMSLSNIFTVTVLAAFSKTRVVPKTAKLLSCGLLTFDSLGIFCLNVRRYLEGMLNMYIIVFGYVFCLIAYMNVIFMSCDRYLIFYRPFEYLRMQKGLRFVVVLSWTFVPVTMLSWSFTLCFAQIENITRLSQCNTRLLGQIYIFFFPVVICVSTSLFLKVSIKLRKLKTLDKRCTKLRDFKSTMVMLCCVVNFVTVALLLMFVVFSPIDQNLKRLAGDLLFTANGVFDTLAYVLVFRECRLILIEKIGCCYRKARLKAEQMKIDIYNIVLPANKVRPRTLL